MEQLSLLDALHAPPVVLKVERDGPVVQGEPDETLRLKHKRLAWDQARIELHQHDNGLWMWSASVNADNSGSSYKVGAKWGRFAETRDAALHYAVKEIEGRVGDNPGPEGKLVLAWARSL